jgi:hypothetical protein
VHEHAIEALGLRIELSTTDEALVAPFLAVFEAFRRPAAAASGSTAQRRIRVRVDGDAGRYDDGERRLPLAAEPLRAAHAYNLLYNTLVQGLDRVYLLHAAAVAAHGRAWLVGAPSGAGKSSLARALLQRGYKLLSDDLAPLALDDGKVHPFPRRVGVTLEGDAVPEGAWIVGDKAFLTAEQLGLPETREAQRPGALVLMNPYDPSGRTAELELGLLGDGTPLARCVEETEGLELLERSEREGWTAWRLAVEGGDAVVAVESALDGLRDAVLFQSRTYGHDKTYAAEPALHRIDGQQAALELLRETLNRDRRSALMRRLEGSVGTAMMELWGLLEGVPCYRLEPAGIEATADLLAGTFAAS